jgi:hypothetical protein
MRGFSAETVAEYGAERPELNDNGPRWPRCDFANEYADQGNSRQQAHP